MPARNRGGRGSRAGVEPVGIGEVPRIAVRRRPRDPDGRPLRDRHVADGHVLQGHVLRGDLSGRFQPEQLLEDTGHGAPVGAEPGELLRVPEEREGAVGDHVHRRLVPSDQQHDGGADDLDRRHGPLGAVVVHQPGQEVALGVPRRTSARWSTRSARWQQVSTPSIEFGCRCARCPMVYRDRFETGRCSVIC